MRIFTVQEVADMLHTSRGNIADLARVGKIRYFTPDHGKHKYLFTEDAVQEYIERCTVGVASKEA